MKALLISNDTNGNKQAHMVKISQINAEYVAPAEETAPSRCEHEPCEGCAEAEMTDIRPSSPLSS